MTNTVINSKDVISALSKVNTKKMDNFKCTALIFFKTYTSDIAH